MKLRLVSVGGRMPGWVEAGVAEYTKRLPRELGFEIVEVPLGNRGRERTPPQAMAREAESIEKVLRPGTHRVALAVRGKPWSTPQLRDRLEDWMASGREVALLVGGPDGLQPQLESSAVERWSLSNLTLPHTLVRVVVAEQIYRAWSLLRGHPYHR